MGIRTLIAVAFGLIPPWIEILPRKMAEGPPAGLRVRLVPRALSPHRIEVLLLSLERTGFVTRCVPPSVGRSEEEVPSGTCWVRAVLEGVVLHEEEVEIEAGGGQLMEIDLSHIRRDILEDLVELRRKRERLDDELLELEKNDRPGRRREIAFEYHGLAENRTRIAERLRER